MSWDLIAEACRNVDHSKARPVIALSFHGLLHLRSCESSQNTVECALSEGVTKLGEFSATPSKFSPVSDQITSLLGGWRGG